MCALMCLLRAGVLNTLWGLSVPPECGSFSVAQIHAAVRVARQGLDAFRPCMHKVVVQVVSAQHLLYGGSCVTSIPAAPSIPKGDSVVTQHARLSVVACGACFVCNKTAGRSSSSRRGPLAEVLCCGVVAWASARLAAAAALCVCGAICAALGR